MGPNSARRRLNAPSERRSILLMAQSLNQKGQKKLITIISSTKGTKTTRMTRVTIQCTTTQYQGMLLINRAVSFSRKDMLEIISKDCCIFCTEAHRPTSRCATQSQQFFHLISI